MYRRLTNRPYPYLYPTPAEGLNVRIFVTYGHKNYINGCTSVNKFERRCIPLDIMPPCDGQKFHVKIALGMLEHTDAQCTALWT